MKFMDVSDFDVPCFAGVVSGMGLGTMFASGVWALELFSLDGFRSMNSVAFKT